MRAERHEHAKDAGPHLGAAKQQLLLHVRLESLFVDGYGVKGMVE